MKEKILIIEDDYYTVSERFSQSILKNSNGIMAMICVFMTSPHF